MFPDGVPESDIIHVRQRLARLYGEDVAQETFAKACERGLDSETWQYWMYSKARFLWKSTFQEEKRQSRAYDAKPIASAAIGPLDLVLALERVPAELLSLALHRSNRQGTADKLRLFRLRKGV